MIVGGSESALKIAFLDVGQGDTTIISCADTREAIVVDCINAKAVIDYLTQEQITHLCGVIVTHLHADHYSEITALLKNHRLIPGMDECSVVAFNEVNTKRLQELIEDADKHSSNIGGSPEGNTRIISTSLQNLIDWRDQNESKYTLIQVQLGSPALYQSEDRGRFLTLKKLGKLTPDEASSLVK